MKKGLLLINLGTPDAPDIRAVRRYLKEFLTDKRVITLPAMLRYLLVYGIILPFRAKKTTRAYQSIWTPNGSPLLTNSLTLLEKVQERLGDKVTVSLGMRYGSPSIQSALKQLSSCSEITVLPLYPQYSSAASGSSIQNVFDTLTHQAAIPSIHCIRDFHNHPDFIHAQAELIKPFIMSHDHLLFSYHGVPEQHLIQTGCASICKNSCPPTTLQHTSCYRAQCYQTSRSIADTLHLDVHQYETAFQSRLGRAPWIKPYTEETLQKLAKQGVKRLAVVCPSFVADCLETLEEIGIRANKQWLALGGERLTLIPCLNDHDAWVEAIVKIGLL